ncbi:hypothetical protein BVU76_21690 [Mycolicibacterium porcinum]|nr:hypothetical protein BVU76_21690 [Mycolicibacterium porcinum]
MLQLLSMWGIAEWGIVVNALAAVGSIGAAGSALYIATRDRKERERQRLTADEAEAKLVFAGMSQNYPPSAVVLERLAARGNAQADHDTHPTYPMWLKNNSDRPLLNVAVIACKMRSNPDAIAELPKDAGPYSIVMPGNESRTEGVKFFAPDGSRLPQSVAPSPDRNRDRWPSLDELDIVAWLGFSDVDGNRWARSSEGELRRITKPGDIQRLLR